MLLPPERRVDQKHKATIVHSELIGLNSDNGIASLSRTPGMWIKSIVDHDLQRKVRMGFGLFPWPLQQPGNAIVVNIVMLSGPLLSKDTLSLSEHRASLPAPLKAMHSALLVPSADADCWLDHQL